MINLIENELKKIFKKKTFYILIIITVAFMILANLFTKFTNEEYIYYYSEGDLEYYQFSINQIDPNNALELSQYVEYMTNIELIKLAQDYDNDSWQTYVIFTRLPEYLNTIVEYEYSDTITKNEYEQAKESYDEAIEKIKDDDWKYFVNQDLEITNSSLEDLYSLKNSTNDEADLLEINKNIAYLEVTKQIDEWRLEKNIDYGTSFLNTALRNYSGNMTLWLDYIDVNPEELEFDELNEYRSFLEGVKLNEYYIENNISLDSESRNSFINLFRDYEVFIILIGIVIAGSIVSEEFNRGTIKLLLVKPYNRVKILISKFIVSILVLLLAIGIIAISQFVVGGIIYGFDGITIPTIVYNFDTNSIQEINIFAYVLTLGVSKLPIYILLTTLAFTLSTLFTNTAIAVSVPFIGYISSSIINQFAVYLNLEWIKFFVTPNWDLTYYLFGNLPILEDLTPLFSIIVCLIYLAIMLVVSSIVFKKRDIKNI